MIPNPEYKEDKELHARCEKCTHVGFELWQVKSGTIFDDILVTDSIEEAKKHGEEGWKVRKEAEQKAVDAAKEAKEASDKEASDSASKGDSDSEEDHDEL
jgi:calreticulin